MFLSWINKKKADKEVEKIEEVKEETKKLLSKEQFNNRLIRDMTKNKIINKTFLQFLIDDANEEVKFSRINDKQSHFDAIKIYSKLLEKEIRKGREIKKEINENPKEENR